MRVGLQITRHRYTLKVHIRSFVFKGKKSTLGQSLISSNFSFGKKTPDTQAYHKTLNLKKFGGLIEVPKNKRFYPIFVQRQNNLSPTPSAHHCITVMMTSLFGTEAK